MAEKMTKEEKQLEILVNELIEKYGYLKVSLIHETGNEGIWAVPIDDESESKLRSDYSLGEYAWVRLCNTPLGWGNTSWGSLIKVITAGKNRAKGTLADQDTPQVQNEEIFNQTLDILKNQ